MSAPSRPAPDSGPDPRPAVGRHGEALAARHLESAGYRILARNWRVALGEVRGELDLVALDPSGGVVVVCEVKTRRGDRYGGPLAAVTPAKQARIRALALAFLRDGRVPAREVRFDVVGIWLRRGAPPRIEHVVGAF